MFSTSASAVWATDVFSSGINVDINGYAICKDGAGNTVTCSSMVEVETNRTQAPYDLIDADFLLIDFNKAKNERVRKNEVLTIDPGVYKSIQVDAAGNKPGSKPGKLIMNPGVYEINKYIVNGQVLPADTNGTVTLMVKSKFDLTNSDINCKAGSHYGMDPNKYAMYIETSDVTINGACISGYMYFKNALTDVKMDLLGAISAESLTLDLSTNIDVDLEYILFTDFSQFLEIGPKLPSGWHMVKAPAEINASVTVEDFFGDDLDISTYGTDWMVYQHDYDEYTYKRFYTPLDLNTSLEKKRGYWLGTRKNTDLKVLGLNPVVWDRRIKDCPSKDGCYRYALQSCIEGDENPSRYNLIGSVASKASDWVDYRVEVNGEVMTPSKAMKENIMSNQIWKYNPSTGTYVTGNDIGEGNTTIDSFAGFWVEMNCANNSINREINLIVPNRM